MARSLTASPQPYLTLDRYRQILNLPLCYFNGVENPNDTVSNCDHCWSQWERDRIAQALADAEGYFAEQLHFWFGERYLTDTDLLWENPMRLNYGYIVGGGVRARDEVTPSASDFTIDPATITVAQASFSGGTSEIVVVEDSTGLEIVPDKIESSGANYVIYIDQCKLIEWDDLENAEGGESCIVYDDTFPATIWLKLADLTVYREYLDTTDQATITFAKDCDCWACCSDVCDGTTVTGCVFVFDQEISNVRINMATYSNGSWSCDYPSTVCGCYHGSKVSVNYLAGTTTMPGWEQVVISLAHTYLDEEPCGCARFDRRWQRDTAIDDETGLMKGQLRADRYIEKFGHGKARMLGRVDRTLRRAFLSGNF
jgi:hypothetical protein